MDIYSVWLEFPNDLGPFLEIMEYTETLNRGVPAVNEPGLGHLAISVPDLEKTVDGVLRFGGSLQGQVTNFGTEAKPNMIVYVRDSEDNILEIDQPYVP